MGPCSARAPIGTYIASSPWALATPVTRTSVGPALDIAACNADFCGTPSTSEYYVLEALEVWIH
jgi:hypothetical protein